MGSESHIIRDPIKPSAEQGEIAKTLAAEQALLDAAQAAITTLQSEVAALETGSNDYDPVRQMNKAITDNTSFDMFSIACADLTGYSLILEVSVLAKDAADTQTETHVILLNGVNKDGTLTMVETVIKEDGLAASGGTLAIAVASTDDTNVATYSITANSSLTPTTMTISYQIRVLHTSGTITIINANS